ncbi:RNA-binding motif protein 25-like [Spinacia oleracea]|uniref:RNA-binding motif protein 25-like n=1 Tax=Spinacia oleracea TaxID=3562 RepID=A0A9R0III0_SPIOL|nr:RNA-binding motif protein 25-like [Spinacia oleracea]XP_056698399.1 RNA-binding motif protein 25-like [Spinacia oleracea]
MLVILPSPRRLRSCSLSLSSNGSSSSPSSTWSYSWHGSANARPPFLGHRPPMTLPIVRPPVVPVVMPAEKPQTTVYVGKIASSVESDFVRSLLELCGPIKSWKRSQDLSDATPRRFGFCEFESAEGVLRALQLLSKCIRASFCSSC